jgi:hypothetical protein
MVMISVVEDGLTRCQGPSAPWLTFAKRERKKESATPVEMTDKNRKNPRAQRGIAVPQEEEAL